MYGIFSHSQFNRDISEWDVSKVTDMSYVFKESPLEGREPIWYKFVWEIKLFPDFKGLHTGRFNAGGQLKTTF